MVTKQIKELEATKAKIVALEKSLNVRISETDARQMRTVEDIHTFIDKAVAAGSVAPTAP